MGPVVVAGSTIGLHPHHHLLIAGNFGKRLRHPDEVSWCREEAATGRGADDLFHWVEYNFTRLSLPLAPAAPILCETLQMYVDNHPVQLNIDVQSPFILL